VEIDKYAHASGQGFRRNECSIEREREYDAGTREEETKEGRKKAR